MSSSTVNCGSLSKKRSYVWYHYTQLENNQAKCNICSEKKSFTGGSTGNLLRHLKTKHPTIPLHRNNEVKLEFIYLFIYRMAHLDI